MPGLTKIVAFPISSQGPALIGDIVGTLKGVSGIDSVFHGPSWDKSKGVIVVNWASTDAWKAFSTSAGFGAFKSKIDAAGGASDFSSAEVVFTPNPPVAALKAPVTCFARFGLKDGSFPDDIRSALAPMPEKITTVGATGGAYGKIEGANAEGIIITGWPSVDAHKAATAQSPLADIRPKLQAIGSVEKIVYAHLQQDA